ncbi:hypothetical protein ZWY2020_000412 [Hordeum vulgare]|nr:hypothetical protein ZWY2020_000412 [Hordeum vulgare]
MRGGATELPAGHATGSCGRHKVMAFVGIFTGFGSVGRHRTLRRTWLPSDRQGLLRPECPVVHSASLQELAMQIQASWLHCVDIVAPSLKQITMSLVVWNMEVSVYVLAPMLEKVSWCCSYNGGYVAFGLWRLEQLRLQTAERQGHNSLRYKFMSAPVPVLYTVKHSSLRGS